jgi:flagellar biosynthetic protein FliQ
MVSLSNHDEPGAMTGAETLDLAREAIILLIQLCAPMMLAGLAVGVAVALLQALTQIQEMTLVFVPKILTVFVVLLISLPMIAALLANFMQHIAQLIAR